MADIFRLSVLLLLLSSTLAVYVRDGNPYDEGPLTSSVKSIILTRTEFGIPLRTIVFYPDVPDQEFPLQFFVGGLYGSIPYVIYRSLMREFANQGVVIAAPWTPSGGFIGKTSLLFDTVDWVVENFHAHTNVTVSSEFLHLGCHSSGCDNALMMVQDEHTKFKTAAFLEPFSFKLREPVTVSIPAFMMGTELRGMCSVEGRDFLHFYEHWTCPRTLHLVQGQGHCDVIDFVVWIMCGWAEFCPNGPYRSLPGMRRYVSGAVTSLMSHVVPGYESRLDYLTNQTLVSLPLIDLQTDVICD